MLFKMLDKIKYLYTTLLILYVYNYDNVYIIAIGIKIYIMYLQPVGTMQFSVNKKSSIYPWPKK